MNKFYNETKKRNCTPNEIAKHLISDTLQNLDFFSEKFGMEYYNEKQLKEIGKFVFKHIKAINKKLNPNNNRIYLK